MTDTTPSTSGEQTELLSVSPKLASLNIARSVAFYRDRLGFEATTELEEYAILRRGEITIHLWPCDDENIPKMTGCYVRVRNIEPLYREYSAQGVIHPNGDLGARPWGMLEFAVLDNDGNLIQFGEPIPRG